MLNVKARLFPSWWCFPGTGAAASLCCLVNADPHCTMLATARGMLPSVGVCWPYVGHLITLVAYEFLCGGPADANMRLD